MESRFTLWSFIDHILLSLSHFFSHLLLSSSSFFLSLSSSSSFPFLVFHHILRNQDKWPLFVQPQNGCPNGSITTFSPLFSPLFLFFSLPHPRISPSFLHLFLSFLFLFSFRCDSITLLTFFSIPTSSLSPSLLHPTYSSSSSFPPPFPTLYIFSSLCPFFPHFFLFHLLDFFLSLSNTNTHNERRSVWRSRWGRDLLIKKFFIHRLITHSLTLDSWLLPLTLFCLSYSLDSWLSLPLSSLPFSNSDSLKLREGERVEINEELSSPFPHYDYYFDPIIEWRRNERERRK